MADFIPETSCERYGDKYVSADPYPRNGEKGETSGLLLCQYCFTSAAAITIDITIMRFSAFFGKSRLSRSLAILGACVLATASSARADIVTYSTQITATALGSISAEDIALNDIYNITFTLDDAASSYDDGNVLIWEYDGSVQGFTMTRDAGNEGIWGPGPFTLGFTQIRMQGSTLSFRFDLDGGNEVSYEASSGPTSGPLVTLFLDFAASGSLQDGDPLSKFLSPTMTGTGTTVQFMNEDDDGAQLGASLSSATAVPEPSTWALIALGAFVVLWQLRRRVA